MAELRAITPPGAVSLPAQVAVVNALRDAAYDQDLFADTPIALANNCRTD